MLLSLAFITVVIWILFQFISPLDFLQGFWVFLSSFAFVFALWLALISFQALLPITNILDNFGQSILEVYRTSFYLLLHMIRLHGPAVFVKDGFDNRTFEDDARENWPGVVVVDSNSAVVFEERNAPPGLPGAFINILTMIGQSLLLIDPRQRQPNTGLTLPRMRGAGIVFTRPRERIHGTVDLRKQFRFRPGVSAYTREGIEVTSRIISIFTIGENPTEQGAVLYVTYIGERVPENLRVITLRRGDGDAVIVSNISYLQEDLDPADRREIHENYQRRNGGPFRNAKGGRVDPSLGAFRWAPPASALPVFNAQRVFEAVFAQASQKVDDLSTNAKNGSVKKNDDGKKTENNSKDKNKEDNIKIMKWTELPAHVASGMFRELIARVNYDELYDVGGQGEFPLPAFHRQLALAMRNNGILAYKLVLHQRGLDLVEGRTYHGSTLLSTTEIELSNPKTLRDRGIRVIFASFGDPLPANRAIYQQRLDTWRATWERDMDLEMADQELLAMRARMSAYRETREDIYSALNDLFSNLENADEALTMRILQALETYASDPRTRELLPEYTLGLMRQVSMMLNPPTEQMMPPPPRM